MTEFKYIVVPGFFYIALKERLFQGTSYSETTTAAGPGENVGTVGICPNQFLADIQIASLNTFWKTPFRLQTRNLFCLDGYVLFGIALKPKAQYFYSFKASYDASYKPLNE